MGALRHNTTRTHIETETEAQGEAQVRVVVIAVDGSRPINLYIKIWTWLNVIASDAHRTVALCVTNRYKRINECLMIYVFSFSLCQALLRRVRLSLRRLIERFPRAALWVCAVCTKRHFVCARLLDGSAAPPFIALAHTRKRKNEWWRYGLQIYNFSILKTIPADQFGVCFGSTNERHYYCYLFHFSWSIVGGRTKIRRIIAIIAGRFNRRNRIQ